MASSAPIAPLPPQVIAQIKSSISITSLNGVCVELLKNSLDAHATKVNIYIIRNRGECIVGDNGTGIAPAEFEERGGLVKPHHTSRHGSHNGATFYGSHGCFLASLSALSHLSIVSKHTNHYSQSAMTIIPGGTSSRHTPALVRQQLNSIVTSGTRVVARNLFGDMPVRVKQRAIESQDFSLMLKEWIALKEEVAALILCYKGKVSVSLRTDGQSHTATISSEDEEHVQKPLTKICSVLHAAGLIPSPDTSSWLSVTGSTFSFQLEGAISLDPSPSKRIQFISVGINPISNHSGTNILYEHINRLFSNSLFGVSDELIELDEREKQRRAGDRRYKSDGYTNKELKGTGKGVNKWPMFCMRIQFQDKNHGREIHSPDDIFEDDNALHSITNLIEQVVLGFLNQNHLMPKPVRRQRSPMKRSRSDNHFDGRGFEPQPVVSAEGDAQRKRTHKPRTRTTAAAGEDDIPAEEGGSASSSHFRTASPFDVWPRVKSGRTINAPAVPRPGSRPSIASIPVFDHSIASHPKTQNSSYEKLYGAPMTQAQHQPGYDQTYTSSLSANYPGTQSTDGGNMIPAHVDDADSSDNYQDFPAGYFMRGTSCSGYAASSSRFPHHSLPTQQILPPPALENSPGRARGLVNPSQRSPYPVSMVSRDGTVLGLPFPEAEGFDSPRICSTRGGAHLRDGGKDKEPPAGAVEIADVKPFNRLLEGFDDLSSFTQLLEDYDDLSSFTQILVGYDDLNSHILDSAKAPTGTPIFEPEMSNHPPVAMDWNTGQVECTQMRPETPSDQLSESQSESRELNPQNDTTFTRPIWKPSPWTWLSAELDFRRALPSAADQSIADYRLHAFLRSNPTILRKSEGTSTAASESPAGLKAEMDAGLEAAERAQKAKDKFFAYLGRDGRETLVNLRTGQTRKEEPGYMGLRGGEGRLTRRRLKAETKPGGDEVKVEARTPSPFVAALLKEYKNLAFKPVTAATIPQVKNQSTTDDATHALLHGHRHRCTELDIANAFKASLSDWGGSAQMGIGRLTKEGLRKAKAIGQVDAKFILIVVPEATGEMVVLVDQHAADERVRVEELMEGYFARPGPAARFCGRGYPDGGLEAGVAVEVLEKGIMYEVDAVEAGKLRAKQRWFARWGIVLRVLQSGKAGLVGVQVVALPPGIAERCRLEPKLAIDLVRKELYASDDYETATSAGKDGGEKEDWLQRMHGCPKGILEMLNSRACRGAVMFNDVLSVGECIELVRRLGRTRWPFICAHGRPGVVGLVGVRGLGGYVDGYGERQEEEGDLLGEVMGMGKGKKGGGEREEEDAEGM